MAEGNAPDNQQQFQDALSQLWGRIQDPNQAPSPTMQPGYPGGPPVTGALPTNGARVTPVPYRNMATPALPAAAPPVAKPATPSDDPAVTMPTLPTVPSFRAPDVLNRRIATRTAIDDVNAAHANDARDNRPHWYDRLLGGVVGGLTAGVTGDEKTGENVGSRVTNRAFNRVDQERQRQLSPLFNHLNAEKEDEPFYANADKSDQTTFEDKRQNAVEERNQITSQQKNDVAQQIAQIRSDAEHDRHEDAQAKLNELADKNKNDFELRSKLLDLQRELNDAKEDKLRQGGKGGEKPATHAQFAGVEAKKEAALGKAKTQYTKETEEAANDPELRKQADANFRAAQQEAQDAYEHEISDLGGSPEHQDVGAWKGGGAPAAGPGQTPPAQAAQPAKGDMTPDVTAAISKELGPDAAAKWKNPAKGLQVKTAKGEIQTWKIEAGKPVLVKTETQGGTK